MKINELELLDAEADGVKHSGFFKRAGTKDESWYLFDDVYAQRELAEYNFTKAQREIYVWHYRILKLLQESTFIYSGDGEIRRRMSLIIYGNKDQTPNLINILKTIQRKIHKAGKEA